MTGKARSPTRTTTAPPTTSRTDRAAAVLVVTALEDVSADRVVLAALNARKVPVARVGPADIGPSLTFGFRTFRIDTKSRAWDGGLRTASREVRLEQAPAVHYRRPLTGPRVSRRRAGAPGKPAAAHGRHRGGVSPGFLAQCAVPDAQLTTWVRWCTSSTPAPAPATLTPVEDGWKVREGGPVRLWGRMEAVLSAYGEAGPPGPGTFTPHVSGDRQVLRHPGLPALPLPQP